jgi:hypothetical protein
MANKIRLGFVGANVRANWASQSHVSALPAPAGIRRRALTTRRRGKSAERALSFSRVIGFCGPQAWGDTASYRRIRERR